MNYYKGFFLPVFFKFNRGEIFLSNGGTFENGRKWNLPLIIAWFDFNGKYKHTNFLLQICIIHYVEIIYALYK